MSEFKPKAWMTCPLCHKPSPFPDPDYREWVGLSNGEMIALSEMQLGSWDLILEVESKLKEKNNV
jgi:hypothetical protein